MYTIETLSPTKKDFNNINIHIGDYIIDDSSLNISVIITPKVYLEKHLTEAVQQGVITNEIKNKYELVTEMFLNNELEDSLYVTYPLSAIPSVLPLVFEQSLDAFKFLLTQYKYEGIEEITITPYGIGKVMALPNATSIDEILEMYKDLNKLIILKKITT